MPERRLEIIEIYRRLGFPAPCDWVMSGLRDIVDEGVLGATNHVALVLPLVARVAAEPRSTALAEALELSSFVARTRGAAAPIVANALAWQRRDIVGGSDPAAANLLAQRASDWDAKAKARRKSLIERGQIALQGCRAPLIYDYSSTVADLVRAIAAGSGLDRIVIPESRAIDGGRRYMLALADLGVTMLFVPDVALEHAVARSDAVLLGAESVSVDGGIVNTIGSIGAARAARSHGLAVYGAADLFKVSGITAAELPEHPLRSYPFLLREGEDASTTAPELETVPPALISTILTEIGPLAPGDLRGAMSRRDA